MNADFDNLLPVRIFSIHSIIRSSTITYLECLEERYVFDIIDLIINSMYLWRIWRCKNANTRTLCYEY